MKRFVLALWLGGAALYTANTIVLTHSGPDESTKRPIALVGQEQSNHPVRDIPSWGPRLPKDSERQTAEVERQQPAPPTLERNLTADPKPEGEPSSQAISNALSNNSPSISGDDLNPEPVAWAKVMLAAKMHSEASVSSPTLRYYPPGSELQVVTRENGWVLVVDPLTSARGWIYEKYYLSWIDGPTSKQAALAPTEEGSLASESKPTPPKFTKRSGTAKAKPRRTEPWVVTEYRRGKWSRPADRRRAMGFFMFGRFGGL
jgi:hypothetical protein